MTVGYIAQTIPAKVVRESGTTLFHVAMRETGDPLQWVAIAQLNGLVDPWIDGQADILIPPVLPSGTLTGILDFSDVALARPALIAPLPSAGTAGTLPTGGGSPAAPSLDFSIPDDSQYLPLI